MKTVLKNRQVVWAQNGCVGCLPSWLWLDGLLGPGVSCLCPASPETIYCTTDLSPRDRSKSKIWSVVLLTVYHFFKSKNAKSSHLKSGTVYSWNHKVNMKFLFLNVSRFLFFLSFPHSVILEDLFKWSFGWEKKLGRGMWKKHLKTCSEHFLCNLRELAIQ